MANQPKRNPWGYVIGVIMLAAFIFAFDYGMKKSERAECERTGDLHAWCAEVMNP